MKSSPDSFVWSCDSMGWIGRVTGGVVSVSGYLCLSFYIFILPLALRHSDPTTSKKMNGVLMMRRRMSWIAWHWTNNQVSNEGHSTILPWKKKITELDATSKLLSQKQDHQCRNKSQVFKKSKQEKQSTHHWSVCLCLCFGLSSLLDEIKELYKWLMIMLLTDHHLILLNPSWIITNHMFSQGSAVHYPQLQYTLNPSLKTTNQMFSKASNTFSSCIPSYLKSLC